MSIRIAATVHDSCKAFNLKAHSPKPGVHQIGGNGRSNDVGGVGVTTKDAPEALLLLGLTGALQLARKWIQAAHANLTSALAHVDAEDNSGGLPTFSRAERLRLANRYFHIDDFPPRNRRFMLERVRVVYATMLQVFERPGGL